MSWLNFSFESTLFLRNPPSVESKIMTMTCQSVECTKVILTCSQRLTQKIFLYVVNIRKLTRKF